MRYYRISLITEFNSVLRHFQSDELPQKLRIPPFKKKSAPVLICCHPNINQMFDVVLKSIFYISDCSYENLSRDASQYTKECHYLRDRC